MQKCPEVLGVLLISHAPAPAKDTRRMPAATSPLSPIQLAACNREPWAPRDCEHEVYALVS